MHYLWLSYPLDINGPRPPAIPAPELSELHTIAKDDARVYTLKLPNHIGTHVDTSAHVIQDGIPITAFSPEELIFTSPKVIDISIGDKEIVTPSHLDPHYEALSQADIALLRFGYGDVRRTDPARYSCCCPGLGIESARWIRRECPNLRALGLDVPSVATIAYLEKTMSAHNELLDGPDCRFLIIEEMKLDDDLTGLQEVRIMPWLVQGIDSGPCSVVGILKTSETRK